MIEKKLNKGILKLGSTIVEAQQVETPVLDFHGGALLRYNKVIVLCLKL